MPAAALGCAAALVASATASHRQYEIERKRKKVERQMKREAKREKLKLKLTRKEREIVESIEEQLLTNKLDGSDVNCPECENKMSAIDVEGKCINYCILCKGCWFNNGELKLFTGFDKDCPSDDKASRNSKYNCPICSKRMREHVFLHPHNLLIDQCLDQHGVYLENGEFERALIIEKT